MAKNFVPPPGSSQVCAGIGLNLDAWHSKGRGLWNQGRLDDAEAVYRQILAVDPRHAACWVDLGLVYEARQRWRDAEFAYRQAASVQPDSARAHNNLASVLNAQGRWVEAETACRHAIVLDAGLAEAYNNLGVALRSQGRLVEADAALRQALALRPDLAQVEANLASVLRDQGQWEEASSHGWRAVSLGLGDPRFHSNVLLAEQCLPSVTPERLARLHAEWDSRYTFGLTQIQRRPADSGDTNRPLRLGLVSPDLYRHSVAFFLVGMLEHLNPRECQVVCYSDSAREDEMSQQIRQSAASWQQVARLSDTALAELIAADQIDVLLDLAGHTAGNRLLVFARRPAPIQITWIGYPGTTGLRAMNYILADRYVIPEGSDRYYSERVLRMPHVYSCYSPPHDAPPISPLPALRNGYVTFGSFNNPAKIGAEVIEVWARILKRAPDARLLLRHSDRYQQDTANRYHERFAALGVAPERIELSDDRPCKNLLEEYRRIDIALDPFPYSGATTTCEAIWMGVPVITCPGVTFAGRHSFSFLSAAGLSGFIADDLTHYEELAVTLAADIDRLTTWRSGLRIQVASSPLCDGDRFAKDLMKVLRQVWAHWCSSEAS